MSLPYTDTDDRFKLVAYPASRIGTIDLGSIGVRKHHVAGFIEVDVTDALRSLNERAAAGRPVSFFSWMVWTIGACIAEDREIQAPAGRGRRLVVFEDVDITVMVEKTVQGSRVPLPLVVRRVDSRAVEEIDREIRDARRRAVRGETDIVLSGTRSPGGGLLRLYYRLPATFRAFLLRRFLRNPFRAKKTMGTVLVTSVASAGRVPGWILPRSMHNLCFALGSVVRKPWVVEDRVEIREILHMTVLFDHDVVDGAPAARFIARLVKRMETRDGAPV